MKQFSLLDAFNTVLVSEADLLDADDKKYIETLIQKREALVKNLKGWEAHLLEGIKKLGDSDHKKLEKKTRWNDEHYYSINTDYDVDGLDRFTFAPAYSLKYINTKLGEIQLFVNTDVFRYLTSKYHLEVRINDEVLESLDVWEVVKKVSGLIDGIPFSEKALATVITKTNESFSGGIWNKATITIQKNVLKLSDGIGRYQDFQTGLQLFQTGSIYTPFPEYERECKRGQEISFSAEARISKIKQYQNGRMDITFRYGTDLLEFMAMFRITEK